MQYVLPKVLIQHILAIIPAKRSCAKKGKVDFFESLEIILIIFEIKPSIQKSTYESAVSTRVILVNRDLKYIQYRW